MENHLSFLTPDHRQVRNFAVRELPRNGGKPLSPGLIARFLRMDSGLVDRLLGDLEQQLFFLVRNREGEVSWAFPITTDRTPHRLRFSTGERIFGAWAEDSLATPFVEGRLRNERLQVEIATSCAHCARPMHILVDENLRWRVHERAASPRVFLPHIDWGSFVGRNIIGDYWRNSVFFWSEEHVREMRVPGHAFDLDEAAKAIGPAQARLFGF